MDNKNDKAYVLDFTKATCLTILCHLYDNADDLIKAIQKHYDNKESLKKTICEDDK